MRFCKLLSLNRIYKRDNYKKKVYRANFFTITLNLITTNLYTNTENPIRQRTAMQPRTRAIHWYLSMSSAWSFIGLVWNLTVGLLELCRGFEFRSLIVAWYFRPGSNPYTVLCINFLWTNTIFLILYF